MQVLTRRRQPRAIRLVAMVSDICRGRRRFIASATRRVAPRPGRGHCRRGTRAGDENFRGRRRLDSRSCRFVGRYPAIVGCNLQTSFIFLNCDQF